MRRAIVAACTMACALAPRFACAEGAVEQAARSFRAGAEAYARGDFTTAARAFEAAYRMAPRAAAAYNAGLAWQGAGDPARAADDYATVVGAHDEGGARRDDAAARLKALESKLARLVVTGPPGTHVSVDGAPEALVPLTGHLAPGRHAVRASFVDARSESRAFDASAGEEVELRLPDPPAAPAPVAAAPPPAREVAAAAPADRWTLQAERPPDGGASLRRTAAWVALGGAVVAAGAAVVFYEQGLSARDQFAGTGQTDASLRDQATTLRTLTQISWGVAGALGVAAGVLLWTSSSSSAVSSPGGRSASLWIGPRGIGLSGVF
jgi:hypothetical protein